jgi:hypothetical protein
MSKAPNSNDWTCPRCNNVNFASRTKCNRCPTFNPFSAHASAQRNQRHNQRILQPLQDKTEQVMEDEEIRSEFELGFADYNDDWGMKVNPDKLNTLNCLNGHLSAEEDYYRDPRRRPRFTFYAVDEQLPPDAFNLERLLSSQDIRPDDLKKLNGNGIRTAGHVRKTGVDELVKSLGLHSSMRYALNSILDSLPQPSAWARVAKNRVADPFRIRLNKDSTGISPRWTEGNFQVEIEELESKSKEGKSKTYPFRIRVAGFDLDTSMMALRPDQWRPEVAAKWSELLDKAVKGNIKPHLHFREAADDYNTFRKSQAVGLLIREATGQAKNLAHTIRDANELPPYSQSESGVTLLNPGLNFKSRMTVLDRSGVETQRKAVTTGLLCPDISLIRGPPGTGKTTVICEIIQQLAVEQGLRILMVAPTHIAVDNVLERIGLVDGPNFLPGVYPLRHASNSRAVSGHLRMFTWDELSSGLRSRLAQTLESGLNQNLASDKISAIQQDWLTQLRQSVKGRDDEGELHVDIIGHMLKHNVNLVCATTIGISTGGHFEAEDIPFDLVIIDEASKATLGEFLVPGIRAKRWLLVGDEKQLSPHVDQSKIDFILARIIWRHFVWSMNKPDADGKPTGKSTWVHQLTKPAKEQIKEAHIREGVSVSKDGNELVGFFAMRPEIQKMFEKCAVSVRISLEQWFEHRMSNNENLRREHQWRIYSSILNLRADLEDKWSEISYDSQVRKWENTKKKIDDDFIRAVANWERKCHSTKQAHERAVIAYKKRQEEIKNYPTILTKAKEGFQARETTREKEFTEKMLEYESLVDEWDSAEKKTRGPKPKKPTAFKAGKFKSPKEPKELSNPGRYQKPKKPVKQNYPDEPVKRAPSWRRPPPKKPATMQLYNQKTGKWFDAMWDKKERKIKSLPPGENKWKSAPHNSGAIKPWCYDQKYSDSLDRLWRDLVMVADFEYNSGFELLAERLSKNKRKDRIVSLNVQHRMHPKIAAFNSQVVYGNEYHSGSKMVERGFPTRLLGTPLKKDDSLILLDTSLFGKEAMEQLDEGKPGRYVNVAEAKVIVEAIDDLAKDLASIPHPDDRYWEIAVISFYKAQAAAIEKALRVSDVVQSKGRRFVDKKTKSVRIEVNVVDRFQGREADVVLLPMTRANNRGSLGFMTVLNRINVATSRARHRLIIVGNARQLEEMGKKYDARNANDDLESSMTENTAPQNFVSQLINHVQKNGRSLQISLKDLRNDWKDISLVRKPRNGHKKGGRR